MLPMSVTPGGPMARSGADEAEFELGHKLSRWVASGHGSEITGEQAQAELERLMASGQQMASVVSQIMSSVTVDARLMPGAAAGGPLGSVRCIASRFRAGRFLWTRPMAAAWTHPILPQLSQPIRLPQWSSKLQLASAISTRGAIQRHQVRAPWPELTPASGSCLRCLSDQRTAPSLSGGGTVRIVPTRWLASGRNAGQSPAG